MIEKIIEWSVKNKFMVVLACLFTVVGGMLAMQNMPLDAIPDLSDVQVIVYTEYPGQAPRVVEDQVTYPLTTAMLSVPFAKNVRGYSFFGMKIRRAIQRSNNDVGGKLIEMGETEFMVRGLGYIRSLQDLEHIAVGVDKMGTPVLLKSIANIQIGPELRRGILEWNGEGEVVGGIVVMRYGENALEVISAVSQSHRKSGAQP